jgi:ABC-type multidrug transport system fused ATPase/permease subunit
MRLGYMSGVSLTGEEASDGGKTIRRLLGYLKPYWRRLGIVAVLSLLGTLCNLAGPILIGRAIDDFITAGNLDGLSSLVILMVMVYLGGGISSLIQGQIMVRIGQRFVSELRTRLFSHIQTLSMAYHDIHPVGDLMSRVSNDTDAINQAISNGLIEFTTNVLLLGGIMVAMFLLNWQLALGTATLLPSGFNSAQADNIALENVGHELESS